MTDLARKFEEESNHTINSIKDTTNLMNYIIIVIDILYILVFFLVFAFFRSWNLKIKTITEFFREKVVLTDDEEPEEIKTRQTI